MWRRNPCYIDCIRNLDLEEQTKEKKDRERQHNNGPSIPFVQEQDETKVLVAHTSAN